MALVKKFENGGGISPQSLENEINNQLSSLKLKSKDERKVRDALGQLMGHLSQSPENKFTVDPVTKKYTITGMGSEAFITDAENLDTNWLTGNIKVSKPTDAMKIALLAYSEAQNKMKPQGSAPSAGVAPVTEIKDKATLGDLGEYMRDVTYGGEKNFRTDFGSLKSDEERKAKIYESALGMINKYKQEAQTNPNLDYADLSNLSQLEDAIASKDWEKFKTASYAMKWQPSSLLLSEEQKAQLEQEAKQKEFASLSPTEQAYANLGYNKLDTAWTPEGVDPNWFKNILAENNAKVLLNPNTGKHMIVNPSGVFNFKQDNPFKEGYGVGWTVDETGSKVYTPETNTALFGEDPYAARNIGRELKIEGLGNVTSAIGWSKQIGDAYAKDALGRRDFTKELVVTDESGKRFKLTKQDDGSYIDEFGIKRNPIITGFGSGIHEIFDYSEIFDKIPEIKPEGKFDYLNSYRTIARAINNNEVSDNITKEASKLRWALANVGYVKNNPKIKAQVQDLLTMYQQNLERVPSNKNGGVLKFQSGNKFYEYAKTKKETPKVNKPEPAKKIKNIEGTFRDQTAAENALDALSLAGSVASFVPGVGAVGGLVSTGADIAKDIVKDGFQWSDIFNWNTGANLAGAALGAVGLGGVRSLLKADKMLDTARGLSKFTQFSSKADWLNKVGKSAAYATRAATIAPALGATASIAEDISEGGLKDVKVRDVKTLTYGLGAVSNIARDFRATRAIGRQGNVETTPDKTSFKLGEREVTVGKAYDIPKEKKFLGKTFGKEKYTQKTEAIREDIGKQLTKGGQQLSDADKEALSALDFSKVKSIKGSSTPTYTLGSKPKEATGNAKKDLRDYNIAKKYLKVNEPSTQSGSPVPSEGATTVPPAQIPEQRNLGQSTMGRNKKGKVSKKADGGSMLPEVTVTGKRLFNFPKPTAAAKPTTMDWTPKVTGTQAIIGGGSRLLPKIGETFRAIKPKVDETDIANALMLANTFSTNTKVGNLQRQAAANAAYTLPGMARQYIRVDAPMTTQGQVEAGNLMSQAGNISRATSDIDKAMGARLSGAAQAAELRGKYSLMDRDRIDKLRAAQQETNAKVAAYNTEIAGKNRAIAGDTARNLGLISANQALAQNTALNNFITSYTTNLKRKEFKLGQKELFDAYNAPEYKSAVEAYKGALSDTEKNKFYKQWQDKQSTFYRTPWEQSQYYKNWQDRINQTKQALELVGKPLEEMKARQALNQSLMYMKKGGSLSKEDKIDIERFKAITKSNSKQLELAFKTILQNNELLQKSLIKVFK